MAIETDDPDIRPAFMYTESGGNGDYYLTIIEIKDQYNERGELEKVPVTATMRFSTSGSQTPLEVRELITQLYRIMRDLGLNEYPDESIQKVLVREK